MKKAISALLILAMLLCAAPAYAAAVVRSPQNLTVDGRAVNCDKYNIEGSNYFKLRDIAALLSGTACQFEVGFANGVVSIATGRPYTPNGSELAVGADMSASAVPSAQVIQIDGETRSDLTAYNIGGNNFFKLRELGDALGFEVDYDPATNTAVVRSGGSGQTLPARTGPLTLTALYTGGGNDGPWEMEEPGESAPVVGDVDGDGKAEIVFMIRRVFCLDAATGAVKWSTPTGHAVSEGADKFQYFGAPNMPQPVRLVDYDGNGSLDIVTVATNYGLNQSLIAVYNGQGEFLRQWTTSEPVRAMEVADFDGDGRCEIAVGLGVGPGNKPGVYLYNNDGSVHAGWPVVAGYGLYSDTMRAVDLNGDGVKELVFLFDEDSVEAYSLSGQRVNAAGGPYAGYPWGYFPVCENYAHELEYVDIVKKGGAKAFAFSPDLKGRDRAGRFYVTGTFGGVIEADMDGDGTTELVFTGMVADGALAMSEGMTDSYSGVAQYFTTFILNKDRTRYTNAAKGFDWTQMPMDTGRYLTLAEDFGPGAKISKPDLMPVAADLDGDGNKEILFSNYDGCIHCFSLDGKEHGSWPYRVEQNVLSFATRPVAADLDGDGRMEVIFGTFVDQTQTSVRGELIVLDCSGSVRARITMPTMWGLNGAEDTLYADCIIGAPAVADVDGDGRAEIVVNTKNSGVCVYKVA